MKSCRRRREESLIFEPRYLGSYKFLSFNERYDEFARVFRIGQFDFTAGFFNVESGHNPPQMRDERRRIQRPAIRIVARKSHDELFAGAGAGDVAEIPLARQAFAQIWTGCAGVLAHFVAVSGPSKSRARRARREKPIH